MLWTELENVALKNHAAKWMKIISVDISETIDPSNTSITPGKTALASYLRAE
jgi:hypothetical protein